MFRHILIPIDGTEHGTEALRAAAGIARCTGAQLVALYIAPGTTTEAATAEADIEAHVRREVNDLRANGIRIKIIFGKGKPQEGILTAIWEQHPSFVILAPHELHGLEALRHPSTTHALIGQAHVPLLMWPSAMNAEASEHWLENADSLVIAPLDGSRLAEQAIPPAEAFAREFGRTILLFRAIPPVLMPGIGLHVAQFERQALAAEEHSALHYLREVHHNFTRTAAVPVDTLIAAGDPSAAILDLTNARPGSLIVMSTHGRSGFARLLLGSVTFEVLHRTSAPLLIVPPHQYAFAEAPETAREHTIVPAPSLELGEA